jgi:beta-xylosidase
MKAGSAITAGLLLATAASAQVWRSDQGDGSYRNPVLYADYPDPDIIRVGRDCAGS